DAGSFVGAALFRQLVVEVVTSGRHFAEVLKHFQVEEMIGFLRLLQSKFGGTAPAVRLWPQISEAIGRAAKKCRHIGWDLFCCNGVDGDVPIIPPAVERVAREGEQQDKNCRENWPDANHLNAGES